MQYISVTDRQLEDLRASLDLLTQLWNEDVDQNALWLYGMAKEGAIVGAMEDAVDQQEDTTGTRISNGVAIIPLSSDSLYYLTGSGLILRDEEFVYQSEGEIRNSTLQWSSQEPRVRLDSFYSMALSTSDIYAEDFLKWENVGSNMLEGKSKKVITRDDEPSGGGVKKSSIGKAGSTPDVWSDQNLDDMSLEDLFALRNKLEETGSDNKSSFFVLYGASDSLGYVLKVKSASDGVTFLSKKLGVSEEDAREASVLVSGDTLKDLIENLLGEQK